VKDLRAALLQERKSCPQEIDKKPIKNGNSLVKRKSISPPMIPEVEVPPLPSLGGIKRPKLNSPRQRTSDLPVKQVPQSLPLQPQYPTSVPCDTNGLDALYSALLAFSNSTETPVSASLPIMSPSSSGFSSETENNSDSSPYSLPSPISISPSTSPSTSPSRDPWSFPFPSSPSSPLIDNSQFREPPPSDQYTRSEEETFFKRIPAPPPLPLSLSFSHPTVLRPRKKRVKSRLAAEISSLSSDILAKLIAEQSKLTVEQTSRAIPTH